MTINEASTYTPEITLCFQFVLITLLLGRIWFICFSLNITAVFFFFFFFFDVLPNSVGCSDFRTVSCQLCRTVHAWEYQMVSFFLSQELLLFSFFLNTYRMCRSQVIPQRLLREGLLSSFSPLHLERSPKQMSETTFLLK